MVVAQFGRVGVLGQASLSAYGVKPVGRMSGAGAGAISARRNEHTSGVENGFRGMQAAKFGHNSVNFHQMETNSRKVTMVTFFPRQIPGPGVETMVWTKVHLCGLFFDTCL
jgi:hypothetical protein